MTTVRARRYPQPPSAATVLDGDRCDHGELDGRCALCRVVAAQRADCDPAVPGRQGDPSHPVDDDQGVRRGHR